MRSWNNTIRMKYYRNLGISREKIKIKIGINDGNPPHNTLDQAYINIDRSDKSRERKRWKTKMECYKDSVVLWYS